MKQKWSAQEILTENDYRRAQMAQKGTNNDDNGVSNPDGSVVSADGNVMSLGRRVTSTSAEIILLPYLMKLPAIFFASAYGTIIPLPKTNVLSYAKVILMRRSLFSPGKEIM
ncbi:hypothetical protein FXV77_11750 [Sphingobacterium phlebotomi]|uniref:Uncharacterized protein n=1 Tax=Sphingobacterium phlebotomi TaxID=2605433 RepID=A0A5D4H3Y8_9SPHI|nr:hypothetical protein [Sphingobacterium phlebotomi]TYR35751.1 hypothetical protein FXV77_11750 [Sphingobacterium phlebotomi]